MLPLGFYRHFPLSSADNKLVSLQLDFKSISQMGQAARKDSVDFVDNYNNNCPYNTCDRMMNRQSLIDILPYGGAGRDLVHNILKMLDMKSMGAFLNSSFIKLFCKSRNDNSLYCLCEEIQYPYKLRYYIKTYPLGTPLIVACEKGRIKDMQAFVAFHNLDDTHISVKDLVSQVGKSIDGCSVTPLMMAAMNDHPDVVGYLLQHGADPNIANDDGENALHVAASYSRKSIRAAALLLQEMSLEAINQKKNKWGHTPLDTAYFNSSPCKQGLVQLIQKYKGKKSSAILTVWEY